MLISSTDVNRVNYRTYLRFRRVQVRKLTKLRRLLLKQELKVIMISKDGYVVIGSLEIAR